MIGKYHNHTLRKNPQQHDEPKNNNNHKTPGRQRKVKHPEAHLLGVKNLWIYNFFFFFFFFLGGGGGAGLRGHFYAF